MNISQLRNSMNVLGFNDNVSTTTDKIGETTPLYNYNGIEIFFSGTYYTIVHGKILLEVAQKIYDKYPNNPYLIRVAGGSDDNKPIDWATSEEYEIFLKEAYEVSRYDEDFPKNFEKIIKAKKQEILLNNPESLYVDCYHIDTLEGLLILLTELQDYSIGKALNKPNNTQVSQLPELLAEINRRLIEEGNPYQNTDDWIEEHQSFVLEIIKNFQNSDEQENNIRALLNKFDSIVNPFSNSETEMRDPSDYLDKVKFNCYAEDQLRLTIEDKSTGYLVQHTRDNEDMTYYLRHPSDAEPFVQVNHYFSLGNNETKSPEEVLYINYYYEDDNNPNQVDMRYNLTTGLVGKTYGSKEPITSEQKDFIIYELLEAIKIAKTVTIDNMCKPKGVTKKL